MVVYDNEFKTTVDEIETKNKTEPGHHIIDMWGIL